MRVGYGNYNAKSAEVYLTGPISGDTLTASVAGTYRDHDPYYTNIVAGVPSVGSAKRAGARAQLRWQAAPGLDLTLRGDYSLIDEQLESYDHLLLPVAFAAPLANSLVGSYRQIAIGSSQPIRVDTGGVSLDVNYNLGGGFAIKSITAWRKLKSDLYNDSDATEVVVNYLHQIERQQQFTQEFNLTYVGGAFNAVAGVFYFGDRDEALSNNFGPVSPATPPARAAVAQATPIIKTRSYAAFAQASYEFIPDVKLVVGARYTTETKRMDQTFTRVSLNPATPGVSAPGFPAIFTVERTDNAFTPKFGLDFQATPNAFFYVSATRGFKSGGFNNAASSAATAGFAPEKIWAYEAGVKLQAFDKRLRLNTSGFIYDYSNLQVRQLLGPGNAIITNAATARINGVEVELLAKPASIVQISANVSYLDARYKSFGTASIASAYTTLIPNQNCVAGVCTFNASGNRLEATPDWSGIVGLDLTPRLGDLELDFHVDWARRGRVYFDASNIPISSQSPYSLFNANISLGQSKGWRAEAYVRNLTDKKFYQTIAGNGIVPGAIAGEPRVYGLRLGYTF